MILAANAQISSGLTLAPGVGAKVSLITGFTFLTGWDRWIRTTEMTESKSAALPLGYIPMRLILFKRLI